MALLSRLRSAARTPSPSERPSAHRVRRWRRVGAIACGALAVGAGVQAASPAPPQTRTVWVAAGDLQVGSTVEEGDLRPVDLPTQADAWPEATQEELVGRTVTSPLAAGDPVTPRAVLPSGGELPAGRELVFLPILDPPVLQEAQPGRTVRLLDRVSGKTLAPHASVRSVSQPDPESTDQVGGLWVLLTPAQSEALAVASAQNTGGETPVAVSWVRPAT